MTPDQFEECLIAWGRLYGNGAVPQEDRSLVGCTLANLGKPPGDGKKKTEVRLGYQRRKVMGVAAQLRGMVPPWACGTVTCSETRTYRASDDDARETQPLMRIQAAWLALWRASEDQAQALRLHYQERRLTREQKAKQLGMTVKAYRESVSHGKQLVYRKIGGQ